MPTLIILSEDERDTINRAISTRLITVREELDHTRSRPNPTPHHLEACRILSQEIDSLARAARLIWSLSTPP